MVKIRLPKWIKPHFYDNRHFSELSDAETLELSTRIKSMQSDNPLISIVIPAWNEGENIFRTLSSLASNKTIHPIEIVVVNNNSTDNTQQVLDQLGVKSYFEKKQGISFARQCGLENAKGKYYLCADSDTFYPPRWIDLMIKPMINDSKFTGVYGRYAFIPPEGQSRFSLWVYERLTGIIIRVRKKNREYLNVMGFTMGLVTEVGRTTGGFKVTNVRVFDNRMDSENYSAESEDGRMSINLKKKGQLKLITHPKAVVYTSPRRLIMDGGIWQSFLQRFSRHTKSIFTYLTGKD